MFMHTLKVQHAFMCRGRKVNTFCALSASPPSIVRIVTTMAALSTQSDSDDEEGFDVLRETEGHKGPSAPAAQDNTMRVPVPAQIQSVEASAPAPDPRPLLVML